MNTATIPNSQAAWRQGFIDDDQLRKLAEPLRKSGYGQYLLSLLT